MVVISATLPLVLLVVLSTYLLTTSIASDPDVCEMCSEKTENYHIRLKYPASNLSAGQIQVCMGRFWQTVCYDPPHHEFTAIDASVACFQLGFTKGVRADTLGRGCFPDKNKYLAVNAKEQCKRWDEKLYRCLTADNNGHCSIETAVSVTCEGQYITACRQLMCCRASCAHYNH